MEIFQIDNKARQTLNAYVRFKHSTPAWNHDWWQNEGIPMYDSTQDELEKLDEYFREL